MASEAAELATPTVVVIPKVPAWAWAVVAIGTLALYTLTLENGALLGEAAHRLHEFLHDGRHVVGVPCH